MTRSALENDLASKLIDHRVRPSATAQKIRDETFRFHATPTFDQDYHAGSKRGKQGLHYGRLTMGQVANAFPETFPSEPCEVASRDAQKKVRRPPRRRLSGPPPAAQQCGFNAPFGSYRPAPDSLLLGIADKDERLAL